MLSLALTLLLASAAPESNTTTDQTTTAPAKPEKARKVCRNDDNTGSRLRKKTCKTQEQWNNQQTDIRGDVRLGGAGGGN